MNHLQLMLLAFGTDERPWFCIFPYQLFIFNQQICSKISLQYLYDVIPLLSDLLSCSFSINYLSFPLKVPGKDLELFANGLNLSTKMNAKCLATSYHFPQTNFYILLCRLWFLKSKENRFSSVDVLWKRSCIAQTSRMPIVYRIIH